MRKSRSGGLCVPLEVGSLDEVVKLHGPVGGGLPVEMVIKQRFADGTLPVFVTQGTRIFAYHVVGAGEEPVGAE